MNLNLQCEPTISFLVSIKESKNILTKVLVKDIHSRLIKKIPN